MFLDRPLTHIFFDWLIGITCADKISTVIMFTVPDESILDTLRNYVPPPRPTPMLGFCCISCVLREQKPAKSAIYTNRTCIKKTYLEKGLPYISELVLKNVTDLAGIIQYNKENNIRLFRMSSGMFPWASEYRIKDLPDFDAIRAKLLFAGTLARIYDQRLTFHPSHYTVLASPKPEVVKKAVAELEVHSECLDLMGFEPSLWTKVNIHIAATYGDKPATVERFKQNFSLLSENCKKRMAIENDDTANDYSISDLLPIARDLGIAVTFDIHHHSFCPGTMTGKEALEAAMTTWGDVTPIVHYSESSSNRKPIAHSDYVQGPVDFYGHNADVHIMLECKQKDKALLRYRDEILPNLTQSENISNEVNTC